MNTITSTSNAPAPTWNSKPVGGRWRGRESRSLVILSVDTAMSPTPSGTEDLVHRIDVQPHAAERRFGGGRGDDACSVPVFQCVRFARVATEAGYGAAQNSRGVHARWHQQGRVLPRRCAAHRAGRARPPAV